MGVNMRNEDAVLDAMERRLAEWAAWLRGGGGGNGYPVTNVLHESWLPPAPGQLPSMQTGGFSTARERQVHRVLGILSVRLQNTVVVVYVLRLSTAEQAARLQCQAGTVRARVAEVKREVWRLISKD